MKSLFSSHIFSNALSNNLRTITKCSSENRQKYAAKSIVFKTTQGDRTAGFPYRTQSTLNSFRNASPRTVGRTVKFKSLRTACLFSHVSNFFTMSRPWPLAEAIGLAKLVLHLLLHGRGMGLCEISTFSVSQRSCCAY